MCVTVPRHEAHHQLFLSSLYIYVGLKMCDAMELRGGVARINTGKLIGFFSLSNQCRSVGRFAAFLSGVIPWHNQALRFWWRVHPPHLKTCARRTLACSSQYAQGGCGVRRTRSRERCSRPQGRNHRQQHTTYRYMHDIQSYQSHRDDVSGYLSAVVCQIRPSLYVVSTTQLTLPEGVLYWTRRD